MDNLTGSMKDVAFATSPREFDLSYSTTLEEIMEKLNARRAAFQMPFQIKGGIPGHRISFEKEPNVDVGLWLFLKDGTHVRIQPVITEAKMSVGGMRVDKNSACLLYTSRKVLKSHDFRTFALLSFANNQPHFFSHAT